MAEHRTEDGRVDNQRRPCPHPLQAIYAGPRGGANDPANWIEQNFECGAPD